MYQKLPNLVLGFHGCKKSVFESVVYQGEALKASENEYDWLGHGIYFWEQNYQRAIEWATNRYGDEGAVVGAVIDLGYCLNLTDSFSAQILRNGYEILKIRCEAAEMDLPQNVPSKRTKDILLRNLDCAVIQQVHDYNKDNGKTPFDSVRGIFTEGGPVYPGAEFQEKTHVQLCVCNPNCIKGYFAPLKADSRFPMP